MRSKAGGSRPITSDAARPFDDASPFGVWWPKPHRYDAAIRAEFDEMLNAVHFPNEPRWSAAARGDAAAAINLAIRVVLLREERMLPYQDVIVAALWRCAAEGDAAAGLVLDWLREHPRRLWNLT